MVTHTIFRYVLVHLYILSRYPALGLLAATHLLVTHVGPCDDVGLVMTFSELTVTTQSVDCSLSGVFNLTEDVANGWKLKATMQKCQDLRNVETCDLLNEYDVVTNGCGEDNEEEEETYSMLFHYADPEIECPLRAGVYKLTDYPVFSEDNLLTVYETKISTSVFGYTFTLNGYSVDGQKIFCVEAYLQLYYIRDHDWLTSHNKTHVKKHTKHTHEEPIEE